MDAEDRIAARRAGRLTVALFLLAALLPGGHGLHCLSAAPAGGEAGGTPLLTAPCPCSPHAGEHHPASSHRDLHRGAGCCHHPPGPALAGGAGEWRRSLDPAPHPQAGPAPRQRPLPPRPPLLRSRRWLQGGTCAAPPPFLATVVLLI